MTIQSINAEILAGNFTNTQLGSIIDAVKFARARLGDDNKRALRINDRVTFDSTRLGRGVTGTVTKIAIKYVTVKTAHGLWKVPASMLTPVLDAEYA
jgi:hypothetical protein